MWFGQKKKKGYIKFRLQKPGLLKRWKINLASEQQERCLRGISEIG